MSIKNEIGVQDNIPTSGNRMPMWAVTATGAALTIGSLLAIGGGSNAESDTDSGLAVAYPPVTADFVGCIDTSTGEWELGTSVSADPRRVGGDNVRIINEGSDPVAQELTATEGETATLRGVFSGDVDEAAVYGETDYSAAPGEPYSDNDLIYVSGQRPDGCGDEEPEGTVPPESTLPPEPTVPTEPTQPSQPTLPMDKNNVAASFNSDCDEVNVLIDVLSGQPPKSAEIVVTDRGAQVPAVASSRNSEGDQATTFRLDGSSRSVVDIQASIFREKLVGGDIVERLGEIVLEIDGIVINACPTSAVTTSTIPTEKPPAKTD